MEFLESLENNFRPLKENEVFPSVISPNTDKNYFYYNGASDKTLYLKSSLKKPIIIYQAGDGIIELKQYFSIPEGEFGVTLVGDKFTTKGNAIFVAPISNNQYHLIHLDLFKKYVEPPLKKEETSGNKVWNDTNSDTYYSDISAAAYTITLNSGITKPILLFQKGAGEGTFVAGSGVTLVGDDLKTTQNDAAIVYPFSSTEYHIIHLDKSKGGGGVDSFIAEKIEGTKTLTARDSGKYFYTTAATDFEITLEEGITEPITIFQKGNGRAEIVGDSGVTLVGANWTAEQGMAISIVPEDSDIYHVIGGSDE